MATGRLPFRGETSAAMFDSILHRAPVAPVRLNPDLPSRLEEIINKALEKDSNLRYQHAADMRADLHRLKRDTDSGKSVVVDEAPALVAPTPFAAASAISAVAKQLSGSSAASPAPEAMSGAMSTRSVATCKRWIAAVAGLLIIAGGAGFWDFRGRNQRPGGTKHKTLAVLYFSNF